MEIRSYFCLYGIISLHHHQQPQHISLAARVVSELFAHINERQYNFLSRWVFLPDGAHSPSLDILWQSEREKERECVCVCMCVCVWKNETHTHTHTITVHMTAQLEQLPAVCRVVLVLSPTLGLHNQIVNCKPHLRGENVVSQWHEKYLIWICNTHTHTHTHITHLSLRLGQEKTIRSFDGYPAAVVVLFNSVCHEKETWKKNEYFLWKTPSFSLCIAHKKKASFFLTFDSSSPWIACD